MKYLLNAIPYTNKDGQPKVFTLSERVSSKWRKIGLQINLTMDTLESYEHQYHTVSRRWEEVMKAWMEGNNPNYEVSWDSLYELLKATNCTQVAEELKIAVENYSEHN